jgi:uncharacterized protein involved in outer membrane biogenesis
MKRKILVAILVLLVLLAGLIGFALYRANDLVQIFKPQIEEKLSAALGAPLSLGELSVSLFPRAELAAKKVMLGAPGGKGDATSVQAIRASIALRPLLEKRLEIHSITIDSPLVILQRDAAGVTLKGLGKERGGAAKPSETQATSPQSASSSKLEQPATPLTLNLEQFSIRSGRVIFDDTLARRTMELTDVNLDAAMSLSGEAITIPRATISAEVSHVAPVSVAINDLTVTLPTKTITYKGLTLTSDAGRINSSGTMATETQRGTITLASDGLDLAKLVRHIEQLSPNVASYKIQGAVRTNLTLSLNGPQAINIKGPLTLKDINADLPGGKQLRNLKGEVTLDGDLNSVKFSSPALALQLAGAPMTIGVTGSASPTNLELTKLSISAFQGEIEAPTKLQLTGAKNFSTKLRAARISLDALLAAFKPDLTAIISGTVTSLTADASGATIALPASLQATTQVNLRDGMLKNVNIAAATLSKIENLPFLQGALSAHVPPEFQRLLSDPNTPIKNLQAQGNIRDGVVSLQSMTLESTEFSLESNGTIRLTDGAINLTATISFSQKLSAGLAERVKELRRVLAPDGRLVIPLAIQGTTSKPIVLPNVQKILELGARDALQKEAGKALDKVLGKKNPAAAEGAKKVLEGLFGR